MKLPSIIGQYLCRFGFHNFRIIEAMLGFGGSSGIEKVECRRCGLVMSRNS